MPYLGRKHYFAAASLALALALAGCGQKGQAVGRQPGPPEVKVETVETKPARLSMTLPGRTAAFRIAELRPQVSGIIEKRLFEEGDEVKAGQALYQIDSAPYKAAYDSAKASLARAEALVVAADNREKRLADLVKVKAVSQQDLDDAVAAAKEARANVAAARAARDSAKVDLDRTTITAPIDGRIGRTLVTDGALVTANQSQALAVVTALDPIYVDLAQSSADILRWKRKLASGELATAKDDSLTVSLTLEDGSVYPQKGKLQLTEVNVDAKTGTVLLRAVFPNPDHLLLPGMFVRAEILEGVREDALLVPQQAVSRNPQGKGVVYVVDSDNKAQPRMVETERAIGDEWLLANGVSPGDRIVVEGFQRFRPGDAVTPVSRVADANDQPSEHASTGGMR